MPKGINLQAIKNYNVIIDGKNFYDQPIDSDIRRYEEMRKLKEDKTRVIILDDVCWNMNASKILIN